MGDLFYHHKKKCIQAEDNLHYKHVLNFSAPWIIGILCTLPEYACRKMY